MWKTWSAWLCLSLMLWTVAAEPTHNHTNPTDRYSCSICVAAHSANPAIGSGHAAPRFRAVGQLPEIVILAKARLNFSDAGIRGPPAL